MSLRLELPAGPPPPTAYRLRTTPRTECSAAVIQRAWRSHRDRQLLLHLKGEYARRTKIARELLETERTYLRQLNMLVDEFEQPLRSATSEKGGPLLPGPLVSQIFPSVSLIRQINSLFAHSFEQFMDRWSELSRVGPQLREFLPTLRIYIDFVSHFDEARAVLTESLAANAEFQAWMTAQLKRHGIMTLSHLLIVPIQRIPRYRMLIAELLKHTPRYYPDAELLERCYAEISSIADTVDSKKKEAESVLSTRLLMQRVEKCPIPLMTAGRRLVLEGPVSISIASPSEHFRKRWIVLFSDLLVVAKARGVSSSELMAIPLQIVSGASDVAPTRATRALPAITYVHHVELEKIRYNDRMVTTVESDDAGSPSSSSAATAVLKYHSLTLTDESVWGFSCSTPEDTRLLHERIMESVRALLTQRNFYDEQTMKVARSKATHTKTLLAEKYASLRKQQETADVAPPPLTLGSVSAPSVLADGEQQPTTPKLRSFARKRLDQQTGSGAGSGSGSAADQLRPSASVPSSVGPAPLSARASSPPSGAAATTIVAAGGKSGKEKRSSVRKKSSTLSAREVKELKEAGLNDPNITPQEASLLADIDTKRSFRRRFGSLRLTKGKNKESAAASASSQLLFTSVEDKPATGTATTVVEEVVSPVKESAATSTAATTSAGLRSWRSRYDSLRK